MTGSTSTSLWTVYDKGVRNYCGNVLPEGKHHMLIASSNSSAFSKALQEHKRKNCATVQILSCIGESMFCARKFTSGLFVSIIRSQKQSEH